MENESWQMVWLVLQLHLTCEGVLSHEELEFSPCDEDDVLSKASCTELRSYITEDSRHVPATGTEATP